MDIFGGFLSLAFIFAMVTGFMGKWIAGQKGRGSGEGFLLGFFLSVIGLIIEGVLPTVEKPKPIRSFTEAGSGVVAVQASVDGRPLRKCFFCAEMVLVEAKICRFCQRDLPVEKPAQLPHSDILYLDQFGTVYHRQDCTAVSIASMQRIELGEIPQWADPCSTCNPPCLPQA